MQPHRPANVRFPEIALTLTMLILSTLILDKKTLKFNIFDILIYF